MTTTNAGNNQNWQQLNLALDYADPGTILSGPPVAVAPTFIGTNAGVQIGISSPGTPLPASSCLAASIVNSATLGGAEIDFMSAFDPNSAGGAGFTIESVQPPTRHIILSRLDVNNLFTTNDNQEYLVGMVEFPVIANAPPGSTVTLSFSAGPGQNLINRTGGALDANGRTTNGFVRIGTMPGQDTTGLFNPTASRFYLKNAFSGGVADVDFAFGPAGSGWIPLGGDWNGNGIDSIGLYNPATGTFYIKNTFSGGMADAQFGFGPGGLNPIAGDWDGDGTDGIGLYDAPLGRFYLRNGLSSGPASQDFAFGPTGQNWVPLGGDWDGDGTDTVGLYNPITGTFFLKNSFSGGQADHQFRFGPVLGWQPIAGDWDGDGADSIGLYNPITGSFFLKNSFSGGQADHTFRFGPANAGFIGLSGDWDNM